MNNLRQFVSNFNEAKEVSPEWVVIDGKKVKRGSPEYQKWEDSRAKTSDPDPDEDDEAAEGVEPEELSKNEKRIKMRILGDNPFFCIGHAGWGKSSIIQGLAEKMGYEVMCVFLDKAVKEDLGGIPIPVKSGKIAKQEMALPAWAAKMYENPDKKYLLFFDEMNQADPQVMNALMPIVLKREIAEIPFKNFKVGAAGNYYSENNATFDLSGPLLSRFKPIIIWDDNNPAAWKAAFKYIRKKFTKKLGKEFIDKFEADCNLFDNPREIADKVFEHLYNIWASGDYKDFNADDFFEYLVGEDEQFGGLFKKDIGRADREKEGRALAQAMYDWLHREEKKNTAPAENSRRRNTEMLDAELVKSMKRVIKNGYIADPEDPKKKYGVCEENMLGTIGDRCIMNIDEVSAEQLARIVKVMMEENDGKDPWRFHKVSEYREKGYLDPPVAEEE